MDPNFRIINLVDPSKSTSKIKECFAKLTLSSRKKADPEMVADPGEGPAPRLSSSISRKLFDDILTDDESDSELKELNRIFRTHTTIRTDGNGIEAPQRSPRRVSKSFSQKLHLSDSDETNCSIKIEDKVAEMHSEMEKLEISQTQPKTRQFSQNLFSESLSTTDQQIPIQQISSQLSSQNLRTETATTDSPSTVAREVDAELENIFTKQFKKKAVNEPRRDSILTISSTTRSTPISMDDDSDIIIISETESDEDYSYPVSSIRQSERTEPNTISGSMAERLDAFFSNIPALDSGQGPETLILAKVPKIEANRTTNSRSSIEDDNALHDESIEICETSEESFPNARSKTRVTPQKYQSPTALSQPDQIAKQPVTASKTTTPKISKTLCESPPPTTSTTPWNDTLPSPLPKKSATPKKLYPSEKFRTPRKAASPKICKTGHKSSPTTEATSPSHKKTASPKKSRTPQKQRTPREATKQKISKSPRQSPSRGTATTALSSTPPQPHEPESDHSSDFFIEKINISTTIKIKLQIGDAIVASMQSSPVINSPSSNARRITQSDEPLPEEFIHTVDKQKSVPPLQTPPVIDMITISTPSSPITKMGNVATPPPYIIDMAAVETPQTPSPLEPEIELDEAAQKLLDQLYGDAWKTPNVVKSLKKANTSNVATQKTANESLMNFSKFHKNIASDLESTRLPESGKSKNKGGSIFKVPLTERKIVRVKTDEPKKPSTELKTKSGRNRTVRIQNFRDSDSTDSNGDLNASSDDSWRDVFTYSSDDEEADTDRKPSKKIKNKNELVYLDLSSDIVQVVNVQDDMKNSPCADNDEDLQERIKKLLETCKAPDKPKIEGIPKNNTKRKLFTARFGDEDDSSPIKPRERVFRYTDNDSVTIKTPLPAMFEPINKQLESIKTGTPIFAITTPKTISKKNKENTPLKNLEMPSVTPNHTKGASNKSDSMSDSTPINKYGFLQSLDVMVGKMFCHPDALIYRDNYRSKKQELAEKLYEIYNQKVFNDELNIPLIWNKKLLNTAGRCSCNTKSGKRFCRIELSEKVLTSADRLRCTLIHELCHAATWIYNGEHGHGATWKKWARRANGIFPELPKIGVCHDYDINYKYTYKCTLCGAKSHAHSKSKKVENIRCSYCHGAIEVFLNKKDKDGNVMATPVREPTGFAKFVKDNYKKHKQPDLKHGEVMKILSKEFALVNVSGKK